ncbi:crotonobetainyl-CoA:carnitine CoA-transferase CaiB-like acyl-CoA transferase [Streptomyces sp. 3330]|uniref:CoA transferase n=1 Tax=Streptomyces sp. 3330 TaxID=2817755 RepID=UPI002865A25D|nr:CoA transferase [Streptomyces sp. 3330]MDR6980196.1 crotonobetainyl-CoA:carnitine CoA-transferase CaiB-like acyl-CoA transferase [Streptomyces sp. 3330]
MTGITFAWSELGGDPALLARVSTVEREGELRARLPVRELARACVGACALAGAELGARRAGLAQAPRVRVDDAAVAHAFVSERRLLVDGRAPVAFAPLSRFWRTADGWVRTHANYPHHRERLLRALALPRSAGPADVGASLAERSARDVEEAVYAAGGLAVASRTPGEWAAQEQAALIAAHPLVERCRSDEARARTFTSPEDGPLLPAAGLRVLDLTRVLAGPVATRTLALLGADVLRIDAPRLPELPDQHADTGFGKRSALLDLTADRRTFEELLAAADVVVTGYRPGALDRFGLSPEALAERRPGLVVAQVSAWGAYGPWGGRRGFDSLVQAATGIAAVEGSAGRPGALPAQALDHGTGYLLAAAVLRALTEQSYEGGSRFVRLALARTAAWLTGGKSWTAEGGGVHDGGGGNRDVRPEGVRMDEREGKGITKARDREVSGAGSAGPDPWLTETCSPLGRLRHALPAVSFDGGPVDWARPPGPWGADPARWL